jgi:hypothetical protein
MDVGLGTLKTMGRNLAYGKTPVFLVFKKVGKEKLYLNTSLMNILKNSLLE